MKKHVKKEHFRHFFLFDFYRMVIILLAFFFIGL